MKSFFALPQIDLIQCIGIDGARTRNFRLDRAVL
jgi:hypothetical protein